MVKAVAAKLTPYMGEFCGFCQFDASLRFPGGEPALPADRKHHEALAFAGTSTRDILPVHTVPVLDQDELASLEALVCAIPGLDLHSAEWDTELSMNKAVSFGSKSNKWTLVEFSNKRYGPAETRYFLVSGGKAWSISPGRMYSSSPMLVRAAGTLLMALWVVEVPGESGWHIVLSLESDEPLVIAYEPMG